MIILILAIALSGWGTFLIAQVYFNKKVNYVGLGVCFFLLGIFSILVFAMPAFSLILNYVYQGQPDPLASEMPAPIVPAMPFSQFFLKFLPSLVIIIFPVLVMGTAFRLLREENPGKISAWLLLVTGLIWSAGIVVLAVALVQFNRNALNGFLLVSLPAVFCTVFYLWGSLAIFNKKFESNNK